MLNSLRLRLILSHTLVLLVIAPLIGLTLLHLIETQVIVTDITDDLEHQAQLVAQLLAERADVWGDEQIAQNFVDTSSDSLSISVTLIQTSGELLATSNQEMFSQSPMTELQSLTIQRLIVTESAYNDALQDRFVRVSVPVEDDAEELVGIVQLQTQLGDVSQQFDTLRNIMLLTLSISFFIAVGVAFVMALSVNRRLNRVTSAIQKVATADNDLPTPDTENIHEFREVIESVYQLNTRLHELETARKKLLANLVHELGRPLGAIQAAVHALQGGATSDSELSKDLLKGIDLQIEHLKPLLDNITRLYEQAFGTLTLNRQPIQLADWLPDILTTWQGAALQKSLDWQVKLPDDLPVVSIDENRMAQIVGNLLGNAIKYTPEGGNIQVSVEHAIDYVLIHVTDSGVGIAPEDQAHIFEPYFRGQKGKRFPQGLGLGLAIARDLTRAHQGELTVTSEEGKGSTFTVKLPV